MKVAINAVNTSLCLWLWVLPLSELLITYLTNVVGSLGYRSTKVIVGLTNTYPEVQAPVLWNYTLCDQYPAAVPKGATITIQCTDVYQQNVLFKYVIVQFPSSNDTMNLCEVEVFTAGIVLV